MMVGRGFAMDEWKGVSYFFIFVFISSISLTVSIMEELSPGKYILLLM